jgi:hypothetical protein
MLALTPEAIPANKRPNCKEKVHIPYSSNVFKGRRGLEIKKTAGMLARKNRIAQSVRGGSSIRLVFIMIKLSPQTVVTKIAKSTLVRGRVE